MPVCVEVVQSRLFIHSHIYITGNIELCLLITVVIELRLAPEYITM